MKERILSIGVEELPRSVYTLKWEEALDKGVNITDYDIVFIDFSSCPVFADGLQRNEYYKLLSKLNQLLNQRKFLDYLGKIASGNLRLVETAAELGKRHGILDYEKMIEFALEMGESSIKLEIENSKKALRKYKLDSHS